MAGYMLETNVIYHLSPFFIVLKPWESVSTFIHTHEKENVKEVDKSYSTNSGSSCFRAAAFTALNSQSSSAASLEFNSARSSFIFASC